MDSKSAGELQEHMAGTYYSLRVGLAVIGIALPLVLLVVGGVLHHVWLEPSVSQYYYTPARVPFLTTRDIFVGGLFAVGACLYLYKGFSNRENVALNLAGVFATLVALLPTAISPDRRGIISTLHAASAVLFFVCLAYVSLFRSGDTLYLVRDEKARERFRSWYRATGILMLVSPLVAVVLSYRLDEASRFRTLVFWVESFGVWTFSAYWIIKTREMRLTSAEKRALDAELARVVLPAPAPAPGGGKPSAAGDAPGDADERQPRRQRTIECIVPVDQSRVR